MTEWASLSWTSINRSGGAEWLTCSLYTCDRHKLKHYLLYKSIAQCQYTESLQNHYNDIHVEYISTGLMILHVYTYTYIFRGNKLEKDISMHIWQKENFLKTISFLLVYFSWQLFFLHCGSFFFLQWNLADIIYYKSDYLLLGKMYTRYVVSLQLHA